MGHTHPESPIRLQAIDKELQSQGLMVDLIQFKSEPADVAQIKRAHNFEYIQEIEQIGKNATIGGLIAIDNDTSIGPGSLRAALLATGAGCQAVDHLMAGNIQRAFCATRPPGHHAEKSLAMGFCLFNNVAVAALHAIEHHGLQGWPSSISMFTTEMELLTSSKMTSALWYVHHFSTHTIQIVTSIPRRSLGPYPDQCRLKGHEYRQKVERDFFSALDGFSPELLLISAGFDAHTEDPLGGLNLIEDDYRWLTSMIIDIADRHSQSRIVSMLEGGYHLGALGRSVSAHIEMMLND